MTGTQTAALRIGVVGAGQMGAGIAEVCARAGLNTRLVDVSSHALTSGRSRLEASLQRSVDRGRATTAEYDAALANLSWADDVQALADRDLVIEAVIEDRQAKTALLRELDRILHPAAILASNTSSIPLTDLAVATSRPENVIGIHFFNPAPAQQLVEIIPALTTSTRTREQILHLVEHKLGKHPVQAPDRAGFIVNALLVPFLLSAIRMVENKVATREDIDAGMVHGCAHPVGPLALCDLIGLDTVQAIAESLHEEYQEPLYAPPPLLRRMIAAGETGRKAGTGFYTYDARGVY
ncbi:3-hydroxybutyryl-CoA dehydrogenase [Streptomyces olivaceus]|uniref:3-hydroxybutyryl-CoA dehydrogenase n=1 Tax=Streptomyces olivaceus TaxID=47716 RepID=UPI001CC9152A|nr:3-hydroxybutyryl-CoA dehydrogenase [Streptomyces olivaceus]MBZ6226342.1 3-hydroxybutyryl-CoA dehydrogenase [Streptomyces olivaceus]